MTLTAILIEMKLLVTGGAGFIGSNFVHYIYDNRPDWPIVVYDKLTYAGNLKNIEGLDPGHVKFIQADICDEQAIEAAVAEVDAVVHFAAESHVDNSIHGPWPFVETNVVGTYRIVEAVRKHNKRLHHVSTDEVYGDLGLDSSDKFSERSRYDPKSPYSASKAGADHLVRAWNHTYKIKATLSNCSNNYGPFDWPGRVIPRNITNIIDGVKPKLYGEGKNVRDWIHAEDHCSAILTILENGKIGETYMVGANGEIDNKSLIQTILELMGKDPQDFEYVPDRPGHDMHYAIDASKIKDELGWEPKYRDFREGLKTTIDWYKAHEAWWRSKKDATEAKYKVLGR